MRINRAQIEIQLNSMGIRKADLAERIGTTAPYLSIILARETCNMKTLQKISDALGVDPKTLLRRD